MSLDLKNLDEKTRRFMLEEVEQDLANDQLYISPRLNGDGRIAYIALLKEAIESHNDDWLAQNLRYGGLINLTEQRRKPNGGYTMVKVPVTAPDTLAEGEFNRFYARGLSRRAVEEAIPALEIYRAKEVMQPRSESIRKIGAKVDPKALLQDLRTHPGVDTALGLPPGPNSGLSVKIPWV
jgi:hypothetical protein